MPAFHLNGCNVQHLSPIAGGFAALPESLIVAPGDYTIFEQSYSLAEEGLYRFLNPMQGNRQCIVFRDNLFALLSAIGWLVSHGNRDNDLSFEELKAKACQGKLIVTCGPCSAFAVQLLAEWGIAARLVATLSLHDRNGYNDGHVLTEVLIDGHWMVFDPDPGVLYSHGGAWLNIQQLTQYVRSNDYQRHPLTASIPVAIGNFSAGEYGFDLWYETCLSTAAIREAGFNRVVQVPVIAQDAVRYYTAGSQKERDRISELYPSEELYFLSQQDFSERFYHEDETFAASTRS
jgi:hypothetical protein